MEKEIYQENIEKYVKGLLPKKEEEIMNRRKENDPEFKSLVQVHELAAQGVDLAAEKHLYNKLLAEINSDDYSKSAPASNRVLRYLIISPPFRKAAAVLLIGIISLLTYQWFNHDQVDINTILSKVEPINLSTAGTSEEILGNAQEAFNRQDYNTAILLFDQYLDEPSKSTDYNVMFYKAIALRMHKSEIKSINVLNELEAKSEKHWVGEELYWQLALNYLQLGDFETGQEILSTINTDSDAKLRLKVNNLLKQLDKKIPKKE